MHVVKTGQSIATIVQCGEEVFTAMAISFCLNKSWYKYHDLLVILVETYKKKLANTAVKCFIEKFNLMLK